MATRFEVNFDGATLVGESGGFGMPVVFLHPGVADRRVWRSQMDALAGAGYHVVAYDRRGHGETVAPDEPFDHLVDLEAVLDQLGIHAAVFVGGSMGGALAIDFAIENPGRTIGLVLVGTAVSGEDEPDLPDDIAVILDAAEYAAERENWDGVNRIAAHMWLDGPLSHQGRVDGGVRDLFLEMNGTALRKGAELTLEDEREPAIDILSTITAPVLLMVGELDFPHIVDRHNELSDEFENAFAVVLEGTAHLPNLERPDLFNPLLLEFLSAVSGEVEE
ncbi:alpha/beta hydrolase [Arsenicitalea aurantiaca]|uniref:Alpha/beta hydrolase n=1 Tax=Arsenicitalea aurantiaca TaxID=1783274 RepID=A0A433XLZ2_9HYPH|nr:alpha/beta hydrolase [Arsenicitalea aurantiaca]RUT35102.1 alpha/beta hydrolase [Arsenicitalea aurantiaca]